MQAFEPVAAVQTNVVTAASQISPRFLSFNDPICLADNAPIPATNRHIVVDPKRCVPTR
jgi:hypothetical protein